MATITEDYISDETFKLLKEKGFDDSCCRFVIESDETYHRGAPTLQMTMKWLREIHLILYIIYPNLESGELRFSWRIHKLEQDKKHYVEELPGIGEYYKDSDELFTTYEKAEESLIKYCLENLI